MQFIPEQEASRRPLRHSAGRAAYGAITALAFVTPAWGQPAIVLAPQPIGQFSALIPSDHNPLGKPVFPNVIRDNTFALWIRAALVNNNALRARDASLLFQQCYGGGFLDDLDTQLTPAPNVKWVGGSASEHGTQSWGQNKGFPTNPVLKSGTDMPPMSYWTRQLEQHLFPGNRNVDSIAAARIADPYGAFAAPPQHRIEMGQLVYRNNGEDILLTDGGGIAKRYAILFAGKANAERHFENVKRVYDRLAAGWNLAGGDVIRVVYGDGVNQVQGNPASGILPLLWMAVPGTAANLQAAITAIGNVITVNDQFFFYASDHGGNSAVGGGGMIPGAGGPPGALPPMTVSPGMNQEMRGQPENVPTLSLDYSMLVSGTNAEVYWNDCLLGNLTYGGASSGSVTLAIDEDCILDGSNEISLSTLSGSGFEITESTFFTGAMNDIPPILAPAVPALSGSSLVVLALLLLAGGAGTLLAACRRNAGN